MSIEFKFIREEEIAQEISTYLMTGMHHSTPEGQKAIAKIVRKHEDIRFIDCLQIAPNPRIKQVMEAWVKCINGVSLRSAFRLICSHNDDRVS